MRTLQHWAHLLQLLELLPLLRRPLRRVRDAGEPSQKQRTSWLVRVERVGARELAAQHGYGAREVQEVTLGAEGVQWPAPALPRCQKLTRGDTKTYRVRWNADTTPSTGA
jgi:hypothetical protein